MRKINKNCLRINNNLSCTLFEEGDYIFIREEELYEYDELDSTYKEPNDINIKYRIKRVSSRYEDDGIIIINYYIEELKWWYNNNMIFAYNCDNCNKMCKRRGSLKNEK